MDHGPGIAARDAEGLRKVKEISDFKRYRMKNLVLGPKQKSALLEPTYSASSLISSAARLITPTFQFPSRDKLRLEF